MPTLARISDGFEERNGDIWQRRLSGLITVADAKGSTIALNDGSAFITYAVLTSGL